MLKKQLVILVPSAGCEVNYNFSENFNSPCWNYELS